MGQCKEVPTIGIIGALKRKDKIFKSWPKTFLKVKIKEFSKIHEAQQTTIIRDKRKAQRITMPKAENRKL